MMVSSDGKPLQLTVRFVIEGGERRNIRLRQTPRPFSPSQEWNIWVNLDRQLCFLTKITTTSLHPDVERCSVVHKDKICAHYWERQVLGKEHLIPTKATEGNTYQLQGSTGRHPCHDPATRRFNNIKGVKRWWRVVPGWWPCSWPMGTGASVKSRKSPAGVRLD